MSKKTTVSLGTALDIAHASSLKSRLVTALTKNIPVQLTSDKVERVDTAGLQLIFAFIKKAETQGNSVHWYKPSDALINASEILGLQSELKLNQARREGVV